MAGSSTAIPPAFQEADRCDVCKCSFNAFRRRHHCRSCGRTLCHDHSSYQTALPQYGIHMNVRVCYECFNKSSSNEASVESVVASADAFSRLNVGDDGISLPPPISGVQRVEVSDCKCGMPLCICEVSKKDTSPVKVPTAAASPQSYSLPKKAGGSTQSAETSAKKTGSTSTNNSSSFLTVGQSSNSSLGKSSAVYDVSGEGLREAIKNGDAAAAKNLLSKGVDANYCDKQCFTLLHLAALFNQTEIALLLMDNGANVESKNAQGETPLDCAPTMLQFKMRNKIEELAALSQENVSS